MKGKYLFVAIIVGMLTPVMLISAYKRIVPDIQQPQETEDTMEQSIAPESIAVTVLQNGVNTNMELETYLVGVVLGEMPASFEPEALKAQTVVARTFTLKCVNGTSKHTSADICTDSSCCQEYISPTDYLKAGGTQEALEKVQKAVADTTGKVLTYEDKLIEATYFSCSGGRTEDAVAVWGTDIPYLQATDSPGEENAAHYTDTVSFTADRFCALLGIQLSGAPSEWFGKVTYTDGGGVATIVIGNTLYRGTVLRQKLGLRSTSFQVAVTGQTITVTTKGFGHRVGMSQYGANAMAKQGSNYWQILSHYYQGAELTDYKP